MHNVTSEEGLGTQIWNATLGDPRVQGGLMFAGGLVGMFGGAALWLIPDPTLLTKVGGGALIGHGADMAAASWNQMWTGQTTQTLTAQGLSKGLQSVGVPPYYANMVSGLAEIGLAGGAIGVIAKAGSVGQAGVKALHGTPTFAAAKNSMEPHRIYSARELIRRSNEPGPFHNFPESFNQQIFEQGSRTVIPNFWTIAKPGLSHDAIMYKLPGSINKVEGVFEIGVRPSISGKADVIMHRFFKPNL